MENVTRPGEGVNAMAVTQGEPRQIDTPAVLENEDGDLRAIVPAVVKATPVAETTAAPGAAKGPPRAAARGLSGRVLRVLAGDAGGSLELRVPHEPDGRLSTRLFKR